MILINKLLATLAIAALVLSGCQGLDTSFASEDPSTLTAEEREIRAVQVKRRQTAIAIGAIIGAPLGVAIARKVAANRGRTLSKPEELAAALVGTAIFAGLGKVTGDYVNSRSQNYGSQQQELRALITAADRDIANYRRLNQTSSRLISQQRSKVKTLNSRLQAGSVSTSSYRSQIASARNNIASLDGGISDLEKQIKFMKNDIAQRSKAGQETGGLSSRIKSLESQKRTLESRRRELAIVYDEVPSEVGAYDF